MVGPSQFAGAARALTSHAGLDWAGVRDVAMGDIRAALGAHPKRWAGESLIGVADGFRPADMLYYRGLAAGVGVIGAPDTGRPASDYALASALLTATPYLLTGAVAWGLAHTDIPDDPAGRDMIRLPDAAVSVWWPPMPIPLGDLRPADLVAWHAERRVPDTDQIASYPADRLGPLAVAVTASASEGRVSDRRLLGVVLLADDDGRPRDEVIWVYAERGVWAVRTGWVIATVVGRRSQAEWWQMLEAVTAVVAWGDWVAEAPIVVRNRAKARRLALAGVHPERLGPVRVLDARHHATAGAVRDASESELRGPVRTHLRRGHWRQQPVGPRAEGRREARWIAPTVVNPGGQPDDRPVAYRLMPPAKRIPPRWVARRLNERNE